MRIRRSSPLPRFALAAALSASPALAGDFPTCDGLTTENLIPQTRVRSAKSMPANPAAGLPAYCEVEALIQPNRNSSIGAVYRLPENWNGKFYGVGGGGFAGNVTLPGVSVALARGYATGSTDMGHASANGLDPSFALEAPGKLNEDAITDFGHRATHAMTKTGKELVSELYGRLPEKSYFEGCSTGGRQGLAEMQRYPDDYDGVIAGAPVYNALVYANALFRVQAFHAKAGSNLLPGHTDLVGKAVMAACDAKDGVADGILNDPRQCQWDPAELVCTPGAQAGPQCLTEQQAETVRKVYAGLKSADGKWLAMPLMPGGESDWVERSIGTKDLPRGRNAALGAPFVSHLVKADPKYDLMSFDPAKGVAEIEASFAGGEVIQQNADLSRFFKRGGKLILWHGFNDPGPSALSTIAYLEKVAETTGAGASPAEKLAQTAGQARLFLAPGVLHCRGGAGPDRFDMLSALEAWAEKGAAPERIIATKAESKISRPLCPYPQSARYQGAGDTNDHASFECRRD